jgi:hypothetical protein
LFAHQHCGRWNFIGNSSSRLSSLNKQRGAGDPPPAEMRAIHWPATIATATRAAIGTAALRHRADAERVHPARLRRRVTNAGVAYRVSIAAA